MFVLDGPECRAVADWGPCGGVASYTKGQLIDAAYACQEGTDGPGIASCTGTAPAGQPINTATGGRHRFMVTATSTDGQRGVNTVSYVVRLPSNQFGVSRIKTHRNGIITVRVKVPGRGRIDVLGTAWNDNLAQAAVLLQPAPHRFVFARAHRSARRAGSLALRVIPNARATRLVHHHTYRVTLGLWITYTPTGGKYRKHGFYGLHLPK